MTKFPNPQARERATPQDARAMIGRILGGPAEPAAAETGVSDSPPAEPQSNSNVTEQGDAAPNPTGKAAAPKQGAVGVPMARFSEVNERMKAAEAAKTAADAELAALKAQLANSQQEAEERRTAELLASVGSGRGGKLSPEDLLAVVDSVAAQRVQAVSDRLAAMEARQESADVLAERGLTREQRSAVLATLDEVPGVSVDEAVTLTQMRNASLFPADDRRSFNPALHGMVPPGRTAGPQKHDPYAAVVGSTSMRERRASVLDLVGSHLKGLGSKR